MYPLFSFPRATVLVQAILFSYTGYYSSLLIVIAGFSTSNLFVIHSFKKYYKTPVLCCVTILGVGDISHEKTRNLFSWSLHFLGEEIKQGDVKANDRTESY